MQYDPGNNFFGDYADIYAEAPYNDFTEGVAKDLPELLSFYGAGTGSYRGLGCGTGTPPIAPAGRFDRSAGVDRSADMLRHTGAAETPRAATEPGGLVALNAHPTWFVDTTVTVASRTEDGRFERVHEVHPQRGHDPGAVTDALVGAGFATVETFAGLDRAPLDENTSRAWYVAR